MTTFTHATKTDLIDTILAEVSTTLSAVDRWQVTELADALSAATRVFVTGEGRSGFMAKAFAMRLMHLGLDVHVIGETTTPSVGPRDTLVAVSGSGTTAGTVRVAEQAARVGACCPCSDDRPGIADVRDRGHRAHRPSRNEVPPRRRGTHCATPVKPVRPDHPCAARCGLPPAGRAPRCRQRDCPRRALQHGLNSRTARRESHCLAVVVARERA